jgi:hypothetical protein
MIIFLNTDLSFNEYVVSFLRIGNRIFKYRLDEVHGLSKYIDYIHNEYKENYITHKMD